MNSTDPSGLDRSYFTAPQVWRFNSPDFYIFYYVIAGILAALFLLLCLLILVAQKPSEPVQPANQSTAQSSTNPGNDPTQVPQVTSSSQTQQTGADKLVFAQQQPSYSLRAEAYKNLMADLTLSDPERQQAKLAYDTNLLQAQKASKRLVQAQTLVKQQYFSAAIRAYESILAEGEILGEAYLEAKKSIYEIRLQKIDYYLRQGQIKKARQAYNEAQQAGVSAEELLTYDNQLKPLEKVGR